MHFPGVRAPRPLLPAENERRLTTRQRELLDELEAHVAGERLADLTMAEIAAELNCSLRTLYGIAPRKDELVLTIADRRLHRIGRSAVASLDATLSPIDALRAYLRAANEAVQPETVSISRDLANIPGARRLLDGHEGYVMAVAKNLLDRAEAEGQIASVDTAAVAHVLGGLGREFARSDAAEFSAASPKATADAIADLILLGLQRR